MEDDSEHLDLTGTPEERVKKIFGVDREQWGRWKLNHETDCLVYTNPKYPASTRFWPYCSTFPSR